MNDTNAMRKRLLKYVGPVTLLSFAFNVVKFFEATVEYRPPEAVVAAAAVARDNSTVVPGGGGVHVVTRLGNALTARATATQFSEKIVVFIHGASINDIRKIVIFFDPLPLVRIWN